MHVEGPSVAVGLSKQEATIGYESEGEGGKLLFAKPITVKRDTPEINYDNSVIQ